MKNNLVKRCISVVFAGLTMISFSFSSEIISQISALSENNSGDVNLDGKADVEDIVLLQKYLLRSGTLTAEQENYVDINNDNTVNIFDLISLKRLINNEYSKYTNLLINEVCSSNKNSLKDAAGASPDWIEIYNASDEEILLDGIGVSDGANKKFKFTFPENTVISGGGYILVYCDDAVNQADGEYHAAFKISATGETVYLTHPEFGEIDSVAVPQLEEDVTFGRYKNGCETFTYLTPTPGESNDSAQDLTAVDEPVFTVEGGFYDTAFKLGLSDTNNNTIYYTTDGSDPRTSSTAEIYSSEINIYNNTNEDNKYSALDDITLTDYNPPSGKVDKGIVVRAVSKTADGKYSPVVTNSYFIGKTASYYNDMKVVSISTDGEYFFDDDTGIYMVGTGYHEWESNVNHPEYMPGDTRNPTNYNKDGKESEVPVNVQVFENGKLAFTADVGARIAGNWSRAYAQKSIRLYARGEYGSSDMNYEFIDGLTDINGNTIDSFDKITLRNAGNDNQLLHFRDVLFQDLVSDRALDIQGAEPCVMFIDGEFWGFYFMREKIEDEYFESHYGIDKNNVTVLKNGVCEGSAEIAAEYKEFCQWAASADMTVPENYQRVCDTLDIQNFMDYIAVQTYINNADWATDYLNNWQMWRSNTIDKNTPYADGKWRFVLFDMDYSADWFKDNRTLCGFDSLGALYTGDVPYNFANVFYNLIKNDDFRQEFYDNYIEIMKNNFSPEYVDEKITEYVSAYEDVTRATNIRFNQTWVNYNYNNEVRILREFFINRQKYAKYYLDLLTGNISVDTDDNMLPSVSSWTHYGLASFSYSNTDNSFTAMVGSAGANPWDIQAQARGLTIETGKTYRLTFEASCTSDTNMNIGVIRQSGNSYPGCWYGDPVLTSEMKKYTYTFTMTEDTASDWFLFFNFGSSAGTYTIKNVSLTEVNPEDAG